MASSNTSLHTKKCNVEISKRLAAYKAVDDHFDESYSYIGIGSGSTVVYVVEAIAAKGRDVTNRMVFVPTGHQSKQLIIEAGLPLGSIDALPPVEVEQANITSVIALEVATGVQDLGLKGKRQCLDVAFDGADEIDEDLNCIKGGGACLFQEKLVVTAAKKVCVCGRLSQTSVSTTHYLADYSHRDCATISTNYQTNSHHPRVFRSKNSSRW